MWIDRYRYRPDIRIHKWQVFQMKLLNKKVKEKKQRSTTSKTLWEKYINWLLTHFTRK